MNEQDDSKSMMRWPPMKFLERLPAFKNTNEQLLRHLRFRSRAKDFTVVGNNTLGRDLKKSARTIQRDLVTLKNLGLILVAYHADADEEHTETYRTNRIVIPVGSRFPQGFDGVCADIGNFWFTCRSPKGDDRDSFRQTWCAIALQETFWPGSARDAIALLHSADGFRSLPGVSVNEDPFSEKFRYWLTRQICRGGHDKFDVLRGFKNLSDFKTSGDGPQTLSPGPQVHQPGNAISGDFEKPEAPGVDECDSSRSGQELCPVDSDGPGHFASAQSGNRVPQLSGDPALDAIVAELCQASPPETWPSAEIRSLRRYLLKDPNARILIRFLAKEASAEIRVGIAISDICAYRKLRKTAEGIVKNWRAVNTHFHARFRRGCLGPQYGKLEDLWHEAYYLRTSERELSLGELMELVQVDISRFFKQLASYCRRANGAQGVPVINEQRSAEILATIIRLPPVWRYLLFRDSKVAEGIFLPAFGFTRDELKQGVRAWIDFLANDAERLSEFRFLDDIKGAGFDIDCDPIPLPSSYREIDLENVSIDNHPRGLASLSLGASETIKGTHNVIKS